MAKSAGVVVVGILAVLAVGACGRTESPAAAGRIVSVTPTQTPSVTPTRTAVAKTTPSDPVTFDLSDGVVASKLYKAGKVPAVRCVLPRPNLNTKAGMLAYAKVFVACMDKAWGPVVERSDAYLVPPEVFAYSLKRPADTPECTDPPAGADAFYFTSGMTGKICFEWDEFLDDGDPAFKLIDFQQLIAHEYGHHVQQSVGILTLYDELMRGKKKAGQLEVMRRKELQASCLGAAFLGANKRTFRLTGGEPLEMWRYIVKHVGDEYNEAKIRDHGSRKNHGYWTIRAFGSTNPASCNTFTAPANRVS
jgi:hypothetical protein